MVVKELNVRGAKVLIHDDFLRSREESLESMKRFEAIAYRALSAKYSRLAQEQELEPLKAQDDIGR